ncbi:MAG: hypothetical protein ABR507_03550 [Actinomycetota bacterium]|nr:hypothetical protein [Actinomycetota bacterium]
MTKRRGGKDLFKRWLWFVYAPICLTIVLLLIWAFGLMPSSGVPVVLFFFLYSALSVRLIVERRKRGVSIPVPRQIVLAIAVTTALAVFGMVSFAIGWKRLSSSGQGLRFITFGGFSILLALMLPFFKVLDSTLKGATRVFKRLRSRRTRASA